MRTLSIEPDEVLDIDDEHGIAVLEQRGRVDVGYPSEPGIEGRDFEIPFAEEGIDDHAELLAAVADHHHRHRVGRRGGGGHVEDLGGHHEPDGRAIAIEILPALDGADLVMRAVEDVVDAGERKGIRLAADVHEQGPDYRHRDRELEREDGLPARLRRHADTPADGLDHALYHVEAHAAAGDFRDLVLRGEARQEQEFEELELRQLLGHLGGDEAAAHGLGPQPFDVDAAAVVGEGDVEHAGAVPGLEADRAHRRLAIGLAFGGQLDAVVERVSNQVRERRLELVEMSRSTPVCSPRTSNFTCLPSVRATSRTSRGNPRMPSASGRIRLTITS